MLNRKAVALVPAVAGLGLPATALALGLRAAARATPAKTATVPSTRTITVVSQPATRVSPTTTMPTARRVTGVPRVGALYATAAASWHGCTASVVDSPRGNTLISAAHCLSGTAAGMVFAPGQHGTQAPYGRWTVTAVYVEQAWLTRQSTRADVAFLTVAPRSVNGRRVTIEQVTGAYKLGATAQIGQRVTVPAYPSGWTDNPITCAAGVYLTGGFPAFNCRGYVGGTSGAPWLLATSSGTKIVGIIGGLHQGGCVDSTSYSSPIASGATRAYLRAASNARADVAPHPGGDGC